jgi:hypothetical protein
MNNPKLSVDHGQSASDFASRLFAGLNFYFEDYRPLLLPILRTNRKHRMAWGLAELSLDIITKPFFQVSWPTVQIEGLLDDPEISESIEQIGVRPDLQQIARQMKLDRTMSLAIDQIEEKLRSGECSIRHAKDAAELAHKLNSTLAAPREIDQHPRDRILKLINRGAYIFSPEYPSGRQVTLSSPDDFPELIRVTRCIDLDECKAVSALVQKSLFAGHLELKGW